MAPRALDLAIRIDADISGLRKNLSAGQKAVVALGERMQAVGRTMTLGITAPITALGAVSVTAAANMDRLVRGLVAVAGSSERAERQMERLRVVARAPGLGFREAIQGSIRLQAAFGEMPGRARLAEDALRGFGNAIATVGGGKAELDRVTLALSQIASRGKVSAEEINQLAEAVPQIRQVMKNAFGTANTELLQMRNIGAEEFIRAIVDELLRLPQATSGAANAFENFSDSLFRGRAAIGQQLLPVLTPLVDGLASMLEGLEEVNPETVRWGIALGAVAAAAGPAVLAIGSLTTAATMLSAAIGVGLLPMIGVGGALVLGLGAIATAFVKGALDAAAFRSELDQLRESATQVSTALSMQQVSQQLSSRMSERASKQARVDEILAAQRRTLALRSRSGGGVFSDEQVANTLTGEAREEFEQLQREIATAEGAIKGLTDRYNELEEAAKEAAAAQKAAMATVALPAGARFPLARLREAARETQEEIEDLRFEAFLAGEENAGKFADKIAEAESRLARLREAIARFPADAARLSIGAPEEQQSIQQGLSLRPLDLGRRSRMIPDDFMRAQQTVQRAIEAGLRFEDLDAETQGRITRAFRERRDAQQSFSAATKGPKGLVDTAKGVLSGESGIGDLFGALKTSLGGLLKVSIPLAAIFEVVKGAMEPLQPVLEMLKEPLQIVGRLLGQVLAPVLKLLLPPLKLFATIVSYVIQGLGIFIEALGTFVDAVIPDFISKAGQGLKRAGQQMQDDARAARDALKNMGKEADASAEATKRATEELRNVPRGFKVALARFRASEGVAQPGGQGARTSGASAGVATAAGGISIGEVHVHDARDPRETWRQIKIEITRQAARKGRGRRLVPEVV